MSSRPPRDSCWDCRPRESASDPGDAAIPGGQGEASRRDPLVPSGRLLRDLLRGREDRGSDHGGAAHLAPAWEERPRAHVRGASSRLAVVRGQAAAGRPQGRHLRPGRGSKQEQDCQARRHPRPDTRHGCRRCIPRTIASELSRRRLDPRTRGGPGGMRGLDGRAAAVPTAQRASAVRARAAGAGRAADAARGRGVPL